LFSSFFLVIRTQSMTSWSFVDSIYSYFWT
jgi:hypothetical protein